MVCYRSFFHLRQSVEQIFFLQRVSVQRQGCDCGSPAAHAVLTADCQIAAVKVKQCCAEQLPLEYIQCAPAQPDRQRSLPALLHAGCIQRLAGCARGKAVQRVAG